MVSPTSKSFGNLTKPSPQQKTNLLKYEQSRMEPIKFMSNAIRGQSGPR
jgi:hypothetical protein